MNTVVTVVVTMELTVPLDTMARVDSVDTMEVVKVWDAIMLVVTMEDMELKVDTYTSHVTHLATHHVVVADVVDHAVLVVVVMVFMAVLVDLAVMLDSVEVFMCSKNIL